VNGKAASARRATNTIESRPVRIRQTIGDVSGSDVPKVNRRSAIEKSCRFVSVSLCRSPPGRTGARPATAAAVAMTTTKTRAVRWAPAETFLWSVSAAACSVQLDARRTCECVQSQHPSSLLLEAQPELAGPNEGHSSDCRGEAGWCCVISLLCVSPFRALCVYICECVFSACKRPSDQVATCVSV
jgi:hypothetical protein